MSADGKKSMWHFGERPDFDDNPSIVVNIPASVATKESLFRVFEDASLLPDYFGENWDAFEECLRDLSWLKTSRVLLIHDGVPFVNDPESLRTYLAILSDAVEKWAGQKEHDLTIVFPERSKVQVESNLATL